LESTNSKPPGPIISLILPIKNREHHTSQSIFVNIYTLSLTSAAGRLFVAIPFFTSLCKLCKNVGPKPFCSAPKLQTMQKCWAKTILLSTQTGFGMLWLFFIQVLKWHSLHAIWLQFFNLKQNTLNEKIPFYSIESNSNSNSNSNSKLLVYKKKVLKICWWWLLMSIERSKTIHKNTNLEKTLTTTFFFSSLFIWKLDKHRIHNLETIQRTTLWNLKLVSCPPKPVQMTHC